MFKLEKLLDKFTTENITNGDLSNYADNTNHWGYEQVASRPKKNKISEIS
jgi:hypothetical protein